MGGAGVNMAPTSEFAHDVETALVTGATGGVGSWVVDRLADDGIRVVGVDLDTPTGSRENAEFHAIDLREAEPPTPNPRGSEGVGSRHGLSQ